MDHLIKATHAVGEYRLVLKQGEIFTPVALRVHTDPISIIGRILEQNAKSYTKITDFVWMGKEFVMAGLTIPKTATNSTMDKKQFLELTDWEARQGYIFMKRGWKNNNNIRPSPS